MFKLANYSLKYRKNYRNKKSALIDAKYRLINDFKTVFKIEIKDLKVTEFLLDVVVVLGRN